MCSISAACTGKSGTAAQMLPLSVGGLLLAASLVLLHEARNGRATPALFPGCSGSGVAATLAANALYGLAWGVLRVALSAWPGATFVCSVELLMGMVRRPRHGGRASRAGRAGGGHFYLR